ncbi:class F sortase [Rhodococcus oxybenzonivorans]|jgi:LPXTG-site transpeptidase (sortase) family protein|uniref:class F sortase n=1 Tax=Rhodococcus TaxID=1827 RepID=UPI00202EC456|nr:MULTISPECIES: class F sortase [Rhodococcus]MDV7354678.1 class F sortase [Rhodococcus oxybenzonivorans]
MSDPNADWSESVPGPEWPGTEGTTGRAKRWWVLAAVLLLVATAFLALRSYQSSTDPQLTPPTATDTVPAPSDGVSGPAPVALRIPALGVDESLITLGLNSDETVEVPTDFDKPGWYKFGPAPGQLGSAVILGHVDSHEGPAVFHRVKNLKAGDSVEVSLTDGSVAHFSVTKVETYPKKEFPAEQVYGSHGEHTLQLVTCGGEFDPHARSYLSNVVAYTSLVDITPAATNQR